VSSLDDINALKVILIIDYRLNKLALERKWYMFKSHKTLFRVLMVGFVVVALTLGATAFGLYKYVSAAVETPTAPGQTASTSLMSNYWSLFIQSFASNLGIDQGKVDAAFSAAVNTTVDQALKDNKITQAQADSIKSRYSKGLSATNGFGGFTFGGGRGKNGFGMGFGQNQLITSADVATALGMTEQDVTTGLNSGKSIADLAKTQNKDLSVVKQALLDGAKTKLDAEVAAKTITQTQADEMYNKLSSSIDNRLNNTGPFGGMRGMRGFGMGFEQNQLFNSADVATALGMTEQDVTTALNSGKSIANLAETQSKDLSVVKQALLDEAKTKLDAEVAAKTITQTQADEMYNKLSSSIDNLLNNTRPSKGSGWFGGFNHQPKMSPTASPGI
jgi:RNA polymerase-interacting CarD/CdnL/TRCF family regulator